MSQPYPPNQYQQQYPGYPPNGYAPQRPVMQAPSNHLAWAIVTVFLFWPTAIFAIIKATQVDRLWSQGQYAEAQQASGTARTLCLVGTIIGGVLVVLAVVLTIMLVTTGAFLTNLQN